MHRSASPAVTAASRTRGPWKTQRQRPEASPTQDQLRSPFGRLLLVVLSMLPLSPARFSAGLGDSSGVCFTERIGPFITSRGF